MTLEQSPKPGRNRSAQSVRQANERKFRQLTKRLSPELAPEDSTITLEGRSADFRDKRLLLRLSPTVITATMISKENSVYLGRDVMPMMREQGTLLDLTPYDAFNLGVSRKHAVIKQPEPDKLVLLDLSSSNGTFINGVRLQANVPYQLTNGDEIHMGKLAIGVIFETIQPLSSVPGGSA
ncbi:MAG: FHA domain-containing protein [Anaerolineales bacterium]